MAAESPMERLWGEATRPVSLEDFTAPVTLKCGHNFCQACLSQCWEAPDPLASCPRCRDTVQQRPLRPKRQPANVVELAKWLSFQAAKRSRWGRMCGEHQEALKLFYEEDQTPICAVCDRSRALSVVPIEESAQEYKEKIETLLKTLRDDREKLLQWKAMGEGKSQECMYVPINNRTCCPGNIPFRGSQLPKEMLGETPLPCTHRVESNVTNCKVFQKVLPAADSAPHERAPAPSMSLTSPFPVFIQKQTQSKRQKIVAEFQQLLQFLGEQERLLLAQMKKQEEEIVRLQTDTIRKLSAQISHLSELIGELEGKCQKPASEFLQDVRSTLRCETGQFQQPEEISPELEEQVSDFSQKMIELLETLRKFKDTPPSALERAREKSLGAFRQGGFAGGDGL